MIEKIKKGLGIVLELIIIVMVLLVVYFLYKSLFWKPYDDATNHLLTKDRYWESVKCEGNTCNITFDSNVSYVSNVAMTSSMLEIIGGNDVIICLNKTPKPGDIVLLGNILHMVYKIEDDTWIISKGTNNMILDPFKYPLSEIDCVVGLSVR